MKNSRDGAAAWGTPDPFPNIRTGRKTGEIKTVEKKTVKKMVEVEEVVEVPKFLTTREYTIALEPFRLIRGDDLACLLIDILGDTNDYALPASEARAALETAMSFWPRKDDEAPYSNQPTEVGYNGGC